MTHAYSVSGMTCAGCAATVKRSLASISGVEQVDIDLKNGNAIVSMTQPVSITSLQESLNAYPAYKIAELDSTLHLSRNPFWYDSHVWLRASFNTLNCLIGCSIGDFAMMIFLQRYYPATSMTVQMISATLAGLITSVSLETILLKNKERFSWRLAFRTALSMSFISMIAMELVMNATDFMITGGKAAFGNPLYWTALIVAMAAGFLAPLPYNYYKLKKFNKACH